VVNFVNRRASLTLAGGVLLLLGLAAAGAACLEYRFMEARRAGLELKLEAALRRAPREPHNDAQAAALVADAGRVAEELGTPWTSLLAELEVASRDTSGQIAILSVEPDGEKHRVHITAESRDLPLALAYVERLQASRLLRYPMLDNHDVRADEAERPVHFAMTAEWRPSP
jgi:hypothetical protein